MNNIIASSAVPQQESRADDVLMGKEFVEFLHEYVRTIISPDLSSSYSTNPEN